MSGRTQEAATKEKVYRAYEYWLDNQCPEPMWGERNSRWWLKPTRHHFDSPIPDEPLS